MSTNKNASPTRWQNPNEMRRKLPVDPAATPLPGAKDKAPKGRDYIGEALAAARGVLATTLPPNRDLLGAIIVAQALDRFGEKLIDAAAVSQYRRTP